MGESPGSVEDNEKLASRAVPTRALDGEEMIYLFYLFYLIYCSLRNYYFE